MSPEAAKKSKEPEPRISSFNENGDVELVFNQEMYLDDIFADFDFTSASEDFLRRFRRL